MYIFPSTTQALNASITLTLASKLKISPQSSPNLQRTKFQSLRHLYLRDALFSNIAVREVLVSFIGESMNSHCLFLETLDIRRLTDEDGKAPTLSNARPKLSAIETLRFEQQHSKSDIFLNDATMPFFVQYLTPIVSVAGNLYIEQCLFANFSQCVIYYSQNSSNVVITRSSFVSNNLLSNKDEPAHITIECYSLNFLNTMMQNIQCIPNSIFFSFFGVNLKSSQCSFDKGFNLFAHNLFNSYSTNSNLFHTNYSRISSTLDSGPTIHCKIGAWKYTHIAEFTSFRTIFRYSSVPIEKANIVNCSGQYVVSRESINIHFIECVFSDISLSNQFDYIYSTPKDVMVENCVLSKCGFTISEEFVSGSLLDNGPTISFQLVNDCPISRPLWCSSIKISILLNTTFSFNTSKIVW